LSSGSFVQLPVRRALFFTLVGSTIAGMFALMAYALSDGGLDWVDGLILTAYALTLPWPTLGLWNAAFGLGLMLFRRDPELAASPISRLGDTDAPITSKTAIAICVRNEEPARLRRNLSAMLADLEGSAALGHVACFVLSDTNKPEIAAGEESVADELALAYGGRIVVKYRRRTVNTDFKAGNIRDFCDRWGADYDFLIVLDADSYMSAAAMLRMIRVMQAKNDLGIAQSLTVGMPSASPFARVFQFGMRLGMRSYTLGSAFWQGDCGPYWGHNAIIRLAPFIEHCHLPKLANGKPILSHDQIEAVLMRRAGFEVRVLPLEDGTWEENPPTLLEFMRRDLRWCEGNMQYWRLLAMPGLKPISRFQLVFAILMFVGAPAWMVLVGLFSVRDLIVGSEHPLFRAEAAQWSLILMMTMIFAPKISSAIRVLLHPAERAAFGGSLRFIGNLMLETVFTSLLAPIMAVTQTIFLGGLALGRTIGWTSQLRDDHAVPLSAAVTRLWPQTLCGIVATFLFAQISLTAVLWAAPILVSLLIAVPFAVVSALPGLGLACARLGIGRIPEESQPPQALSPLRLPALILRQPVLSPQAARVLP
jgi:membrane glycosyltransferase